MSTILNALRRLEREREAKATNLRHQVAASGRAEARPRLPLLAAAGAGGAVLVVASFVFMEGRLESPPATPTPTPAPQVAAPPPAVEVEVVAAPARFVPPPVVEAMPVVAAAPPPAPAPVPVREVPGIVGQPEVASRAPVPHVVVQRTLWHPTRHRRLAFLQVEGRKGTVELREGDAVGDLVVQQIDPSAVLFLHRGIEIRRRVGAGS